ncbi:MAG: TetR/AcrR family transcriptional regulator [Solirubrobacterales bacterium]|nr:TetR/AcrR family transcriptional regulator [Solirubrobacterales bacterium]MBV9714868.1 TetR/AcrR family transcriptional regulator [Solirubrobacterales bacterium]
MSARVKTYNSPLREEQARRTRERILAAARRTFREQGYGATTLADIARAAGVAEPTVRATFKTKPNLVEHLLRLAVRGEDTEPQLQDREAFQRVLAATDPDTLLERLADLAEALHKRSWDVMEIARGAASSDPAIAEIYEQRPRVRLTNQRAVARRLAELGALPNRTSIETAADLLWLYTAPEIYRMLVIERKWSPNRYRTWFRAAVGSILA